jgi:AcrR family transcriptional regulator
VETAVNLENASVQRILRAASASFGRRGYHGSSLSEIARDAGVAKSLLHYHFASKEELFLEVQLQLCRDLLDQVRALTRDGQGSMANLDRALSEVMEFVERDLDHILVILELPSVAPHNPEVRAQIDRFNAEILGYVEEGVRNALGPLCARLVIPAPRLARLIVTVFNGLIVDLGLATGETARAQVRETFEDTRALLTRALLRPTPELA